MSTTLTAVHKASNERAGVPSSPVNMAQQIGAGRGLAIFTTIAITPRHQNIRGDVQSKNDVVYDHATALDSDTAQALPMVIADVGTGPD